MLRLVIVSTHSRPKATGPTARQCFRKVVSFQHTAARRRLRHADHLETSAFLFQHTAARRRLVWLSSCGVLPTQVSTHSRPKATGVQPVKHSANAGFQHTAARRRLFRRPSLPIANCVVSTHSRPKATACYHCAHADFKSVSTHSRPKATDVFFRYAIIIGKFQHTAARRRLGG